MRIVSAESRLEDFGLTRPYSIAFRSIESVANMVVEIRTDSGRVGLGAASPEPRVTGETLEACRAGLAQDRLAWLAGRDAREIGSLCGEIERRLPEAPAARAALDIAIHDLWAQDLGLPLADALGRAHAELPTSITIGIKGVEETLEEAGEYVGRGFTILKVKTGLDLAVDLERLRRLRETIGGGVGIRVDANQGYTREETIRFFRETEALDLELIEQPMKAVEVDATRGLPEGLRNRIAADESLLGEEDARSLASPPRACGIFNIKLMKCGGIAAARRIAAIAAPSGVDLMWGCMDESRVSIAAALHAAFSCPATRYLDLDGSLDLARDVVEGGFVIEKGRMRTLNAPGLGVRSSAL